MTTTRATNDYPLPPPLAPYADQLSRHGQWSSIDPYGPVWIPSAPQGWRPYTNGSWRYTRYGWTWIDSDPWAWPVHHFGRWGHHASRGWYWIPQRTWGPAWVGWAVAADHVAWSPLGWDARPVVDFFAGARVGPIDVWANSWSFMPRRAFGSRGSVSRHLEDPRRLPGPVLGGFVSQMIGPRGPAGYGDRFAARPGRRPQAPTSLPRDREWRLAPRREPQPEAFGSAAPARPVGGPEYPRGEDRTRPRRPGDAPPRDDAAIGPRPGDARPREARPEAGRSDERSPDSVTSPRHAPAAPVYRSRPADDERGAGAARPRRDAPGAAAPSSPPPSVAPASTAPSSVTAPPDRGAGERSRSGGGAERRDGPRPRPEGAGAAAGGGDSRRDGGSGQGGRARSAPSSTDGNRRRPR